MKTVSFRLKKVIKKIFGIFFEERQNNKMILFHCLKTTVITRIFRFLQFKSTFLDFSIVLFENFNGRILYLTIRATLATRKLR